MQQCYYETYLMFEQQARQRNHVVDEYNYNPNNQWHNLYLQNQQSQQLSQLLMNSICFDQSQPQWDDYEYHNQYDPNTTYYNPYFH